MRGGVRAETAGEGASPAAEGPRREGPVNAWVRKWLMVHADLLLAAVLSLAFCGYLLELSDGGSAPSTEPVATDAAVEKGP